jgi:hypothetical protein
MYKLECKSKEKIFLITFGGLLSKEEGEDFLVNLSGKLRTLNPSQYYVVVDTQDLKASGQDSLDNIKNTIELLITSKFRGYYNIVPKSIITELQAKRVVKNDMFSLIKPVKSYEEILNLLN